MKQLTAVEVHAKKVAELGLDPEALDLASVEALAAALRRAASFLCPCSSKTLVRSVLNPLRGLLDELSVMDVTVEETLDAMIAHGDLLEHPEFGDDQAGPSHRTVLYLAPPSFVMRASGNALLIGASPDSSSLLPADLATRIEHVGHVRRLSADINENLRTELLSLGVMELPWEKWLSAPKTASAAELVATIDASLDSRAPSYEIPGLMLLDPHSSTRYYRGRWIQPSGRSGRFVARRAQAYGADLWCYVQLRDGHPDRMIDFPSPHSRWRGCDEAWQLQLAIDSVRQAPQRFRLRSIAGQDFVVVELFSPLPMWVRRRWDAIGEPVSSAGCLFAYRIRRAEIEEEVAFMREVLWLKGMEEAGA